MALVSIMVTNAYLAPDMRVGDYPPDIKEKYGPMSEKARRLRLYIALLFFLVMVLFPILALFRPESLSEKPIGFGSAFLSSFLVLLVFNVVDLLIQLIT